MEAGSDLEMTVEHSSFGCSVMSTVRSIPADRQDLNLHMPA